jgi:hypothetical protein
VKMRRQRDIEQLQRGKIDPNVVQRGFAHDPAFLLPVPMCYSTGSCTTVSGHIVGGEAGGGCLSVSSSLFKTIFLLG